MTKPAPIKTRRPVARYMLVGIVILAVAAVILAWMDETGIGNEIIQRLNAARKY